MADQAQQELEIRTVDTVYLFPKGLPGFWNLKEFTLREHNDVFSLLTAVQQPTAIFITVNPFDFIAEYEFEIPDETIEEIGIINQEQIGIRCIVTWHSDKAKTTVNLLAPLIFNTETHKAKQVVLQNTGYTTKHALWTESNLTGEGGAV